MIFLGKESRAFKRVAQSHDWSKYQSVVSLLKYNDGLQEMNYVSISKCRLIHNELQLRLNYTS